MWRQQHINFLGSPSSFWLLQDSSLMFLSALNFWWLDSSTATRLQRITPWYWWRPYFWGLQTQDTVTSSNSLQWRRKSISISQPETTDSIPDKPIVSTLPPKNFRSLFYLSPHCVEPGGSSSSLKDHELTPILSQINTISNFVLYSSKADFLC